MKLPRSESPPNDVAAAKRRFLEAAAPLNPLLIVQRRPFSSVAASAALGLIVGVMAESSVVRLLTMGWLSKAIALGFSLFQKYGMDFLHRASPGDDQHAVG